MLPDCLQIFTLTPFFLSVLAFGGLAYGGLANPSNAPVHQNPGKSLNANGTAERACTLGRLCRIRDNKFDKTGMTSKNSVITVPKQDKNKLRVKANHPLGDQDDDC